MKTLEAQLLFPYIDAIEIEIKEKNSKREMISPLGLFQMRHIIMLERTLNLVHAKPILRTFDQMTDDEIWTLDGLLKPIEDRIRHMGTIVAAPEAFQYLIKRGFDCFGWIKQDLAKKKS